MNEQLLGNCDNCEAPYELSSRNGRCGDCGDCSKCCKHKPKFYNAEGLLTSYAFACGYVETKNGYRLEKDGCYHVKGNGIWTTASTMTEARKKFRKLAKHIHTWQDVAGIDGETLVGAECEECELFLDRGDFI